MPTQPFTFRTSPRTGEEETSGLRCPAVGAPDQELRSAPRVEDRDRFIEEEDLGSARHRCRQAQALEHPTGEVSHPATAGLGQDGLGEDGIHVVPSARPGEAGCQREHFGGGEPEGRSGGVWGSVTI
jgi:hypothetical protein